MTEREVLDLLRARHVRDGNGGSGEYAYMEHVRNAAGFSASRTFDAISMSLWPSRGLLLHGFEVKCSRSDWLRELKDPAKAEAAAQVCDRFSLVVSDAKVVADGELPPTWGLLVVQGSKLVCKRDAPLLHEGKPGPLSRSFVVAMLRSGGAVPRAEATEVAAARAEGRSAGREETKAQAETWQTRHGELASTIADFERAAGVSLHGWNGGKDATNIGTKLRAVLDGDSSLDRLQNALVQAQRDLRQAADYVGRFIAVSE